MSRPRVAPPLRRACALALLATAPLTAACGGDADREGASAAAASVTPAAAGESTAPFPFTEGDLEGFERGLAKEIELVRAARQRANAATTPQARGEATQAQWKEQTMPEAARAVGIAPERYQRVRETVTEVLQTLDFQGKIDGPMSMDTARATPEMRQRLARDPVAELAPASAAALRARMDRLVPVWVEYVRLTAVGG